MKGNMGNSGNQEGSPGTSTIVILIMGIVHDAAGTLSIGVWINCILYGVELAGLFKYFSIYKSDHWLLMALVSIAAINDTFAVYVTCASVYGYTIRGFGNMAGLLELDWHFTAWATTLSVSAICTQAYLAWRLHKLAKIRAISVLAALIPIAQLPIMAFSIHAANEASGTTDREVLFTAAKLDLTFQAAGDLTISIVLFMWLSLKMRTVMPSTKAVLLRLMFLSAESGLVTACLAFAALGTSLSLRTSNTGIAIAYTIGRVYSLTLLMNLLARPAVSGEGNGTGNGTSQSIAMGNLSGGESSRRCLPKRMETTLSSVKVKEHGISTIPDVSPKSLVGINITTEHYTEVDEYPITLNHSRPREDRRYKGRFEV